MKNKYFAFLVILLFLIFWIWWIPGPRVANDFPLVSDDFLKFQFNLPFAWNERGAEGLGEYGAFTLWSYPINLIFGFFAYLNLANFEILEKALVVGYILLGSFSIWKFLGSFEISNKSKFLGSIFYLSATYPMLLIDGGQISIALSYAIFPLCYLVVYKSINEKILSKLKAGLLLYALSVLDIRFVYVLFLLLCLRFLFDIVNHSRKKTVINWLIAGFIEGGIIISLNIFWLYLQIKAPIDSDIFSSFTKLTESFVNIGHSFLSLSPHWYKNAFGKITELKPEFILIPILVFSAPILRRRNKDVAFWLITAIFSIFLVKGGGEPMTGIYPWLYSNIPGFSLFRDSTKFFFPLVLAYSFLLAITFEELFKLVVKYKKLTLFLFLLFTFYFLYLIRPVFFTQTTGTFTFPPMEKEYENLSRFLQQDKSFGRVFWIPGTKPLSHSDLNHTIVEAGRVFNRPPFVFGVKGTYEIFNFLREAPYMGEIFDVAGIAYIIYPPLDPRRDNSQYVDYKYYYLFLSQLKKLPWVIDESIPLQDIPVLKTKKHQDRFFITDNSWFVLGSPDILNESTKSGNLSLSKNAIIFADQTVDSGDSLEKTEEAKIVLNKKSILDFQLSFVPKDKMIFPQDDLGFSPDASGWWKRERKDIIGWREFLQSKYKIDSLDFDLERGWAIAEGEKELEIKNPKIKKGNLLFGRIMESSAGGQIDIFQRDRLIKSIVTTAENTNVRWFFLGDLEAHNEVLIKTKGKINVINALAVISTDDWNNYEAMAEKYKPQISEYKNNIEYESESNLSFERINPTKYRITIKGLEKPRMLIFSESFDPNWKLNEIYSTKVYGFLNGFFVSENGEYILTFEPQKYILPGLAFSLCSLLVIVLLILKLKWIK